MEFHRVVFIAFLHSTANKLSLGRVSFFRPIIPKPQHFPIFPSPKMFVAKDDSKVHQRKLSDLISPGATTHGLPIKAATPQRGGGRLTSGRAGSPGQGVAFEPNWIECEMRSRRPHLSHLLFRIR